MYNVTRAYVTKQAWISVKSAPLVALRRKIQTTQWSLGTTMVGLQYDHDFSGVVVLALLTLDLSLIHI